MFACFISDIVVRVYVRETSWIDQIGFCWGILSSMIPKFPKFKKLEITDKDDIESFTKNYPPYSVMMQEIK